MSLSFVLVLFAVAVPRVDRHQQAHLVLREIRQANEACQVASFGALEPSWVFYGGRPILELTGAHPTTRISASDFFGAGEDRFILTTDRHWEHLQKELPDIAAITAECPLFLKKNRLLLVGRKDLARAGLEPPVHLIAAEQGTPSATR